MSKKWKNIREEKAVLPMKCVASPLHHRLLDAINTTYADCNASPTKPSAADAVNDAHCLLTERPTTKRRK